MYGFIRKNAVLLLVMAIVLLSASSVGAVTMQGKLVQGRFVVPMRAIFEALGAGVDWDGDTGTVTGIKDDICIKLTINSKAATVNNKAVELDVPATIIDGRTYVPTRFVSEALGANVEWDGKIRMALITLEDIKIKVYEAEIEETEIETVEEEIEEAETEETNNTVFDDSLQALFKQVVDNKFNAKRQKAGLSVALYKGGYEAWTYVLGQAGESKAMTSDTPSFLYSITKAITSTAVMQLVQDGRLSLDMTVEKALAGHPDFAALNKSTINMKATVAHLLNHTSGIQDYMSNTSGLIRLTTGTLMGKPWKAASLLNLIQNNATRVGTHQYSNANYVLLGMIVEHVSGDTFEEYLSKHIMNPLGITGALLPRQTRPSNLAEPYDDLATQGGSSGVFGNLHAANPFFITGSGAGTWSAAGMTMNAEDVAKLGYNIFSTNGLLLGSRARTILLNSTASTPEKYGYGVTKVEMEGKGATNCLYGHGGNSIGYITALYYNPNTDIAVAVLSNSNNTSGSNSINTFDDHDLMDIIKDLINACRE